MYAEWEGKRVKLYDNTRVMVRQFSVPNDVVGVKVSGDSRTDAMVAIAMDNGHTRLYRSSGELVRQ